MNISDYSNSDTINGDGIRCSIWVSGCTLNCKGCFSPKTHDFEYGDLFDIEYRDKLFNDLSKSYISGLSILGGHPFEIKNIDSILDLLFEFKQKFPEKTIFVWSGLTLDKIKLNVKFNEALKYIDTLIDGPFVESLKDTSLYLRGSSNQRILKKNIDF